MFNFFKKVIHNYSVVYNPNTKEYLTKDYKWSTEYADAYKWMHNQNDVCNASNDLYKNKITGEFLLISGFIIK